MEKLEIRSIDVWPLAKISFLVLAVTGLVLGMFYFLVFMAAGSVMSSLIGTESAGLPVGVFSAMFGLLFAVGIAVFYALFGTFFTVLLGVVYNYFAGLAGGLVLTVRVVPPVADAVVAAAPVMNAEVTDAE